MESKTLQRFVSGPKAALKKLNAMRDAILAAKIIAGDGITLYESPNGTQINALRSYDELSGLIEAPEDTTYILIPYCFKPCQVVQAYFELGAGTCTAALKIEGTAIVGMSSISVSTTGAVTVATTSVLGTVNHGLADGEALSLTISSTSSAEDLAFSIHLL